jgi:hypothetical protein
MASGGSSVGEKLKIRFAAMAAAVIESYTSAAGAASEAEDVAQKARACAWRTTLELDKLAATVAEQGKRLKVKNSCAAAQSCAHAPE